MHGVARQCSVLGVPFHTREQQCKSFPERKTPAEKAKLIIKGTSFRVADFICIPHCQAFRAVFSALTRQSHMFATRVFFTHEFLTVLAPSDPAIPASVLI